MHFQKSRRIATRFEASRAIRRYGCDPKRSRGDDSAGKRCSRCDGHSHHDLSFENQDRGTGLSELVPVEQFVIDLQPVKISGEGVSDGRFTRTGESCKPNRATRPLLEDRAYYRSSPFAQLASKRNAGSVSGCLRTIRLASTNILIRPSCLENDRELKRVTFKLDYFLQ